MCVYKESIPDISKRLSDTADRKYSTIKVKSRIEQFILVRVRMLQVLPRSFGDDDWKCAYHERPIGCAHSRLPQSTVDEMQGWDTHVFCSTCPHSYASFSILEYTDVSRIGRWNGSPLSHRPCHILRSATDMTEIRRGVHGERF